MIAAPALPLLGLLPLRDQPADRLDDGAAAPLRPRGDAEGGRSEHRAEVLAVVPVMIQRILQPARRDARPLRACRRCGSPRSRARRCRASWRSSGWTASATTSTTSTARPRSPRRPSPRPRTCAPRPAPPAGRRAGPSIRLYDEDGKRGPAGRGRPHLRRQRDGLRGLHRRRRQGGDRRPLSQRRRRPLRRGRAPLHRRPRRRDDRLRRRERLPARGRGPARRPRGGGRGGGDRGRGRGVRPAAEGVRRPPQAGVEVSEDELKAHVKANLASYKAPREIEFLDELPRNATGKVLKRELHEREAKQLRLDRPASPANCGFSRR